MTNCMTKARAVVVFRVSFKAAPPGPLDRCSIRGQTLPGPCGLAPGPRQSPAESRPDHRRATDQRASVLAGRAGLRDDRFGATLRYVRGLSASRQTSTRSITPSQGGSLEFGRRLGAGCPLDAARSGFARSDGMPKRPPFEGGQWRRLNLGR
jgi:hypothetical protein